MSTPARWTCATRRPRRGDQFDRRRRRGSGLRSFGRHRARGSAAAGGFARRGRGSRTARARVVGRRFAAGVRRLLAEEFEVRRVKWTVVGLALAWALACGDSRAWSATFTWSSAATATDWNTASNWGGTLPGSADIGVFSAAAYNSQPSLTSTAAVGGIWDIGAGNVTIGGTSALTLFGTTINGNTGTGIELDVGAGPLTINAPLVLQNNQQWLNNRPAP